MNAWDVFWFLFVFIPLTILWFIALLDMFGAARPGRLAEGDLGDGHRLLPLDRGLRLPDCPAEGSSHADLHDGATAVHTCTRGERCATSDIGADWRRCLGGEVVVNPARSVWPSHRSRR